MGKDKDAGISSEEIDGIISKVEEDAELPELTDDDLRLPASYDLEILAGEALKCLQAIRISDVGRAGVESAGDAAGAKRMLEARIAAERTLRQIKRENYKAISLAKEIAVAQADQYSEFRREIAAKRDRG